MAWNGSVSQYLDLTGGYHINLAPSVVVPDTAQQYVITPTSPDCVFAGDPGQPATLPTYDANGVVNGSTPNPDGPVPYTTQFLLFPDEATAKTCLSDLWVNDTTV